MWDIARRAGDVGLCLDTFQTAGGEWGDPTTASGRIEDLSEADLQRGYEASLARLAASVPAERIYVLQLSDAYQPPVPLAAEAGEDGLRPRGRWSRDFRPMPFDGGYLPIVPVVRAVLETGFRGWFRWRFLMGGGMGMESRWVIWRSLRLGLWRATGAC